MDPRRRPSRPAGAIRRRRRARPAALSDLARRAQGASPRRAGHERFLARFHHRKVAGLYRSAFEEARRRASPVRTVGEDHGRRANLRRLPMLDAITPVLLTTTRRPTSGAPSSRCGGRATSSSSIASAPTRRSRSSPRFPQARVFRGKFDGHEGQWKFAVHETGHQDRVGARARRGLLGVGRLRRGAPLPLRPPTSRLRGDLPVLGAGASAAWLALSPGDGAVPPGGLRLPPGRAHPARLGARTRAMRCARDCGTTTASRSAAGSAPRITTCARRSEDRVDAVATAGLGRSATLVRVSGAPSSPSRGRSWLEAAFRRSRGRLLRVAAHAGGGSARAAADRASDGGPGNR